MNVVEILRSLRRRWYIVVPGLLAAVALSFGAWTVVQPTYERSASQMLLPGTDSVPEGGNPYIYIGGLTQAADVVVRALGSNNVMEAIAEEYPGAEVQVSRDPSSSGPMILITVTAPTDDGASAVLDALVAQTAVVMEELQDQEDIAQNNRISVIPVTVDEQSVPQQRNRVTAAAAAGLGTVVLALLLTVLVDGLIISRARTRRRQAGPRPDDAQRRSAQLEPDVEVEPEPDTGTTPTVPSAQVSARDAVAAAAGEDAAGDESESEPDADTGPRRPPANRRVTDGATR